MKRIIAFVGACLMFVMMSIAPASADTSHGIRTIHVVSHQHVTAVAKHDADARHVRIAARSTNGMLPNNDGYRTEHIQVSMNDESNYVRSDTGRCLPLPDF